MARISLPSHLISNSLAVQLHGEQEASKEKLKELLHQITEKYQGTSNIAYELLEQRSTERQGR